MLYVRRGSWKKGRQEQTDIKRPNKKQGENNKERDNIEASIARYARRCRNVQGIRRRQARPWKDGRAGRGGEKSKASYIIQMLIETSYFSNVAMLASRCLGLLVVCFCLVLVLLMCVICKATRCMGAGPSSRQRLQPPLQ